MAGATAWVSAQTTVPALITTSQTWTKSGSPYLINQNSYIDTGVKVKVMPGVVIKSGIGNKLIVDGEFQILGKKDTPVIVKYLNVDYTNKSKDYNPTTQKGALLKYAKFDSTGNSGRAVSTMSTSIRILGCEFSNHFYSLYLMQMSDTVKNEIEDCKFINTNYGSGYHIYMSGNKYKSYINNCSFNLAGGCYFYGDVTFTNNRVNKMDNLWFYGYGHTIVECNSFKNVIYGCQVTVGNYFDSTLITRFANNTFDTMGYSAYYPMLKLTKNSTSYHTGKLQFLENNFLHYSGTNEKVQISGYNSTPTKSEKLNFKNNYWGTTDTTKIKNSIKDYSDDITIWGKVDYTNFLTSKDTSCKNNSSTCSASYIIGIDTNQLYNVFLIDNSTGTDTNTVYDWTIDTAHFYNSRYPQYYHNGFGKIQVCLHIYNSKTGCNSTYCDSLAVDTWGNYYAVKTGYNINVLSWADFQKLLSSTKTQKLESPKIKAYPNPANDWVHVEIPAELRNNALITITDLAGKVILSNSYIRSQNRIDLNTSNFSSGYYFIEIKNKNYQSKTNLIIQK